MARDSKLSDPAQYQRFRDLAAELEAQEDEKPLERGVKKLGKAPRPPKQAAKKHK